MITLTAEEHAALIADLKERIFHHEIAAKHEEPSEYGATQHKIYQIALASLEAKQEPCDYCNGTGISPEVGANSLGAGCGSCCGTGKSGLYDSPPVAVMQPVVLPAKRRIPTTKGHSLKVAYVEMYHPDEVHEAIRTAGGSVKE